MMHDMLTGTYQPIYVGNKMYWATPAETNILLAHYDKRKGHAKNKIITRTRDYLRGPNVLS